MAEVKPLTIDNMGIGASKRYAEDQEKALVGKKLINESGFIPDKATVSVVTPYLPTEFAEYLAPNKPTSWALFVPPPEYFGSSKPLFSYSGLIPTLGDNQKLQALIDKLEGLQEGDQERKVLLDLLKNIYGLERILDIINAQRNRYQRG